MLDPKKFRRNLIHSPSSKMLLDNSDSNLMNSKKTEKNLAKKINYLLKKNHMKYISNQLPSTLFYILVCLIPCGAALDIV